MAFGAATCITPLAKGTDMSNPTRLAIIEGSTREQRQGENVSAWFLNHVRQNQRFDTDLIKLAEIDFDAVQSPHHPRTGNYSAGVQAFADRVAAADAFAFITPEYNHSFPASLKHALDSCYAEWNGKAAVIVSYGGLSGGVRAAEQLRPVLAGLAVATMRDSISVTSVATHFPPDGPPVELEGVEKAAGSLLAELDWWAQALAAKRAVDPYP